MKLQTWVDNKANELRLEQKCREVKFTQVKPVKMSSTMIQESFSLFGEDQKISLEVEIEEIDRSKLPKTYNSDEYMDAVKVVFEVLKPRKRKSQREYFYVQLA